jgi:putative endopeptidase
MVKRLQRFWPITQLELPQSTKYTTPNIKYGNMSNQKILFILLAIVLNHFSADAQIKKRADPVYQNLDTSVRPGDNFFKYANGGWLKRNPIPPAYSSWGIGNVINEDIRERLRKINEDAEKATAAKGTSIQKIGDFYYSGLDSVNIERIGVNAIKPELDRIEKIKSKQDVLDAAAYLTTIGVRNFIGGVVAQDAKNSVKMILHFRQTGLGLPNRDYYFKADTRTSKIRDDYAKQHLPTMLRLSGLNDPAAATAVFAIEKSLADSSRNLVTLRDPYKNYNKTTVAQLNRLTPNINWTDLLPKLGLVAVDTVIVGQPEYYRAVDKALMQFSVDDWRAYLRWKLISATAPFLNKEIDDENFRFTGTVISGRKEQLPRWKRVLDTENGLMGELLGQLFVKQYFPAESKKRYEQEVEAIRQAYRERIGKLDWMSRQTKEKALQKLNSIHPKVGYPDEWKDYSNLQINRNSYVQNVLNARKWAYLENIHKVGKAVNHKEWNMTPQTYNASYSLSNNEITLPAAQLMIPGVMDKDVDDAVSYGYVAASTIGHEITHGFDDQGRQFDANGNLRSWWTSEDSAKFTQRAEKLVDQFNAITVLDSLHVNGKATLGENIADLGGIMLGLDAYKKTQQFKEGKKINGLTPLQRFFLGYTLGWLDQARDEALANQVMTDVHSPNYLRVNVPLSNVDDFYKAFNIKKGDPMWIDPEKRVNIW